MKTLQNVIIDGEDYGKKPEHRNSMYCNEGKWNNFIVPLLPENPEEMTFIEIGCNAGLFLKLAKGYGFRKVLGVEESKRTCEVAENYRRLSGLDYDIYNASVDKGSFANDISGRFDINRLPAADVVLLSNVHYHLFLPVFLNFINEIRRKTRYVIVVSATNIKNHRFPKHDAESVRKYFSLWKEDGFIGQKYFENDPYPRDMFSIRFKSEIHRVAIKDISRLFSRRRKEKLDKIIKSNKYYPLNAPITIYENYLIIDGLHRITTAVREGYETILAELCP